MDDQEEARICSRQYRGEGAFRCFCGGLDEVIQLEARPPPDMYADISQDVQIGARQKGDSKWENPLSAKICGFSAVSCKNLRFPAVFCANLQLPTPLIYRASRKSAKICNNLRSCAFRVRFLPFAVSLLARPEQRHPWAVGLPCLTTSADFYIFAAIGP